MKRTILIPIYLLALLALLPGCGTTESGTRTQTCVAVNCTQNQEDLQATTVTIQATQTALAQPTTSTSNPTAQTCADIHGARSDHFPQDGYTWTITGPANADVNWPNTALVGPPDHRLHIPEGATITLKGANGSLWTWGANCEFVSLQDYESNTRTPEIQPVHSTQDALNVLQWLRSNGYAQ